MNRIHSWSLGSAGIAACATALCAVGFAQTTAPGTSQGTVRVTTSGTTRIAAGIQVKVRISQAINSKTATEGDQWSGIIASDLVVSGHTVVPTGTQVAGVVSKAISAERAHGSGTLELELTSIRGSSVNSAPVVRQGVNAALTTGNLAAAGIPGESPTSPSTTPGPGGAPQTIPPSEARVLSGSILSFTTQ